MDVYLKWFPFSSCVVFRTRIGLGRLTGGSEGKKRWVIFRSRLPCIIRMKKRFGMRSKGSLTVNLRRFRYTRFQSKSNATDSGKGESSGTFIRLLTLAVYVPVCCIKVQFKPESLTSCLSTGSSDARELRWTSFLKFSYVSVSDWLHCEITTEQTFLVWFIPEASSNRRLLPYVKNE